MSTFDSTGTSAGDPARWNAPSAGQPDLRQPGPPQSSPPYGYAHNPDQGYALQGGYPDPGPSPGPGPYPGPSPYPAGQSVQRPAARRGLPRALGEIVVAVGGLLFFIASFLNWISFDLGIDLGNPCADLSDPDLRASCEESLGSIASGFSANGWDLILTSAAAVFMILLAVTAAGMALRLIPSRPAARAAVAAGIVAADVIVLVFFAFYDYSSLGSTLTAEAIASTGPASAAEPGFSLDLGFWLALVGLLAVNVGAAVAQAVFRRSGPTRR